MVEKAILEPLLPVIESDPELAVPIIVAERAYETVRDIDTLISSTTAPSTVRRRIPQPFYRGSQMPPPTYAHTVNPRGGSFDPNARTTTTTTTTTSSNPLDNTTTTYEVPREPTGRIDLDAIMRQIDNSTNTIRWLQDEMDILRDRKEVKRIRREIIASDENPYPPRERKSYDPIPEGQIEIPQGGDIDLFGGDFNEEDWKNQNIVASDTQLSDEDVGLGGEPFPRNRTTNRRIPWWRIFPPEGPLQNPKFELPPQQTPTQPPPTPTPAPAPPIDNPPTETPTIIEVPPIPMDTSSPEEETPIPTVTEDIHKENILLIQPVPYEVQVPVVESHNAFPLFASGVVVGALILGIPSILNKK